MRETEEQTALRLVGQSDLGDNASMVMNNKAFKEAVSAIKSSLLQKFETTQADESERRDELWRQITQLNTVVAMLNSYMKHGEVAKEKLTLMQKIKKSLRG